MTVSTQTFPRRHYEVDGHDHGLYTFPISYAQIIPTSYVSEGMEV